MVEKRTTGLAALVVAAGCWGSTVVTISIATRGLPTMAITMIEVATGVALLGLALMLRRGRLPPPTLGVAVAGILEPGVAYPLINTGIDRTSGSHAAVVIGLEAVFIVLLSSAFHRAPPTRRTVLALALATTGAALIGGDGGAGASFTGDAFVAAGVLAAAAYVLVAQGQLTAFDGLALTFYQFLFGLCAIAFLTVAATFAGSRPSLRFSHAETKFVLAAVLAGALGSAVAFLLYNAALVHVDTAVAATSLGLIPTFGLAMSSIFLGDPLTRSSLLATTAVAAGVILTARPAAR